MAHTPVRRRLVFGWVVVTSAWCASALSVLAWRSSYDPRRLTRLLSTTTATTGGAEVPTVTTTDDRPADEAPPKTLTLLVARSAGENETTVPRYFLGDNATLFAQLYACQNRTFRLDRVEHLDLSSGTASDDDDDDTGTPQKKKTTRERLLALWKQGELVVNDRERWRRATAEPLGFKVGEDVVRGGAARARAVWRGLEESNDVAAALQFLKSDIPSALDASKTPRETLRLVLDHFKREFPYYRDTCSHCGARGTEFIGEVACTSSDEAIRSRASRAELRSCSECGSLTRFVRSNAVETILAEKRGRCGEYATAFLAILFALRVEGRWIFDTTDHVWVEANIGDTSDDSSDTWIHCDPCEAALNEPLLYSANWGKKGSLVVGFSNDSATDLTPKYYPDTEQVGDGRKRDELSDDVIQSVLRGYGASGEIASSSRGGAASSSLPAAASSSSVPGGSDAPDASTKPVAAPEVAKAR